MNKSSDQQVRDGRGSESTGAKSLGVDEVRAALAEGRVRFLDVEILCERGVLVPRPETEPSVLLALRRIEEVLSPIVVDHCSGSGNIGLAIANARPDARVWLCDLSEASSALARRNVMNLGFEGRVEVATGDLYGALPEALCGAVHLVVASPPFISTGRLASDRAHLLEDEPREAFDAGPYGLSIHQRLVKESAAWLAPGGHLVVEYGVGQHAQVRKLYERAGVYDEIELAHDETGAARGIAGRRRLTRAPSS